MHHFHKHFETKAKSYLSLYLKYVSNLNKNKTFCFSSEPLSDIGKQACGVRKEIINHAGQRINHAGQRINHAGQLINHAGQRIIGGSLAELGEFPWQAAIGFFFQEKFSPFCGGSLVSRKHLVTAAHCLYNPTTLDQFVRR